MERKPRVGVLLSGCGVFDGSEIHEAVLTLLALDRAGAEAVCMAPDVPQRHVFDHQAGRVAEGETRNVRTEAARIARGPVRDVADARADELDALVLPGGYGAAKNLSDFAFAGADAQAQPDVARLLGAMLDAQKPVGVACIAPAVLAAVLRDRKESAELTVGDEGDASAALAKMGIVHVPCTVAEHHADPARPIVSTPAYMLPVSIAEVARGIDGWIAAVLERVAAARGGAVGGPRA